MSTPSQRTLKHAITSMVTFLAASTIAALTAFGPASMQMANAQPVQGRPAVSTVTSVPQAASPTEQRAFPASIKFTDATEKKAAVDITDVFVSGATTQEPAAVSVYANDDYVAGDAFGVYLNIDSDAAPDVLISGMYVSEFGVYLMNSWTKIGKDISSKGCARMQIYSNYADVSFSPDCFTGKTVDHFSANVRTAGNGGVDDHAPGKQKFSKAVDAHF